MATARICNADAKSLARSRRILEHLPQDFGHHLGIFSIFFKMMQKIEMMINMITMMFIMLKMIGPL